MAKLYLHYIVCIIIFSTFFFSSQAQNCEQLEKQLTEQEQKLDKNTPSSYANLATDLNLAAIQCENEVMFSKSLQYLQEACQLGDFNSLIAAGNCFLKGSFGERQPEQALSMYFNAAQQVGGKTTNELMDQHKWIAAVRFYYVLLLENYDPNDPSITKHNNIYTNQLKNIDPFALNINSNTPKIKAFEEDIYLYFEKSLFYLVKGTALAEGRWGEEQNRLKAMPYLWEDGKVNKRGMEGLLVIFNDKTSPYANGAYALATIDMLLNNSSIYKTDTQIETYQLVFKNLFEGFTNASDFKSSVNNMPSEVNAALPSFTNIYFSKNDKSFSYFQSKYDGF